MDGRVIRRHRKNVVRTEAVIEAGPHLFGYCPPFAGFRICTPPQAHKHLAAWRVRFSQMKPNVAIKNRNAT